MTTQMLGDEYSLRLCRQIVDWRYEDLPCDVIRVVKMLLLDTLGVIGGAAHASGIG